MHSCFATSAKCTGNHDLFLLLPLLTQSGTHITSSGGANEYRNNVMRCPVWEGTDANIHYSVLKNKRRHFSNNQTELSLCDLNKQTNSYKCIEIFHWSSASYNSDAWYWTQISLNSQINLIGVCSKCNWQLADWWSQLKKNQLRCGHKFRKGCRSNY